MNTSSFCSNRAGQSVNPLSSPAQPGHRLDHLLHHRVEPNLPLPLPRPVFLLQTLPAVYHKLSKVSNKTKDSSLPQHRPYDCTVDLSPGLSPPKGNLHSPSASEREEMDQYMEDSSVVIIIRPSSSPVDEGAFLCGKERLDPTSLHRLLGTKQYHNEESLLPRASFHCL